MSDSDNSVSRKIVLASAVGAAAFGLLAYFLSQETLVLTKGEFKTKFTLERLKELMEKI